MVSKLLFGKWAVCSSEQPLIFNKFICRNFLKQLVELFFALQPYLSLEKFSRSKELYHVDIGCLQACPSHVDTDGLSPPLPTPLRRFLPESLVTPTTLLLSRGTSLTSCSRPHPLMQAVTLSSRTSQMFPKCSSSISPVSTLSFTQRLELHF